MLTRAIKYFGHSAEGSFSVLPTPGFTEYADRIEYDRDEHAAELDDRDQFLMDMIER